jgi:hypothetical protein
MVRSIDRHRPEFQGRSSALRKSQRLDTTAFNETGQAPSSIVEPAVTNVDFSDAQLLLEAWS